MANEFLHTLPFDRLDKQADTLEEYINNTVGGPIPCQICPENGCISLDMSQCQNFDVLVTEDITCMRFVGEGAPGEINFVIPPDATRHICGFPSEWQLEGNECDIDLAGGILGRTYTFKHNGTGGGSGAGGGLGRPGIPIRGKASGGAGVGGSSCFCSPSQPGLLTMKSCSVRNKLDCTASSPAIQFKACGGMLPYTWSSTKGSLSVSNDQKTATLRPPTNTGSGVAGTAFRRVAIMTSGLAVPPCTGADLYAVYGVGCDGTTVTSACALQAANPAAGCAENAGTCGDTQSKADLCNTTLCSSTCQGIADAIGIACDVRTAPMIAAGCEPCQVMQNTVVTVTDALGISVSIVVSA